MRGKAFVRKWPNGEGHLTMLVMLTDGLGTLDDETLYAFDLMETPGTIILRELGKRQTDEFRGSTADGILGRL